MLTTILRIQYLKNPKKIIKVLKNTSVDLLKLFKNNGMIANADKCHLLVNSKEKGCTKIGLIILKVVSSKSCLGFSLTIN